MTELIKVLEKEKIEYKEHESMKLHTSFKIGGEADLFVCPETPEQVVLCVETAKEFGVNYTVVGNGSNLLVSDLGIEGMVICLEKLSGLSVADERVTVYAGTLLGKVANVCAAHGLSGMEFAAGIPGSIGGAVYMNAGAYGGEMKDIVESVRVLENGQLNVYDNSQCDFGYRKSAFAKKDCVIISATLKLMPGKEEDIREIMRDLSSRRRDKQPLEYPSAGSTFKRPEGHFAGGLIEQSGLKGHSCGGAQVSEKHAGFVINKGNATCGDVLELIAHIKDVVYKNSGVMLEEEVKVTGRMK